MVIEVNEDNFPHYMEGLGYVKVVRCQNCKYWMAIINDARNGACTERETLQITPANGYCYEGKPKCANG